MEPDRNIAAGSLIGSCDVFIGEDFIDRARCWIDIERGEFAVEVPCGRTELLKAEDDRLHFKACKFLSQMGELTAEVIQISFSRSQPHAEGWSTDDTILGRMFDFRRQAAVRRFVCNRPVELHSLHEVHEILFRPTKSLFLEIQLEDGVWLNGTDYGLCIRTDHEFGEAEQAALSLALGCPLKKIMQQSGRSVRLLLNRAKTRANPRPFFDQTKESDCRDIEATNAGIIEIYQSAVRYQKAQKDDGQSFRFAIEAFIEARAKHTGYALTLLAAFHMLEHLDGTKTIDHKKLAEKFHLPEGVAQALTILRNEVSHNHVDLSTAVERAVHRLNDQHIKWPLGGLPDDTSVFNFVVSLVGKMLLQTIDADVTPVRFIPDYGEFRLEVTT